MTRWDSLQARLAIGIGLLVAVLWIAVASVTSALVGRELDMEFDSSLQETAQRILPIAVIDILGREDDDGPPQEMATVRSHDEFFTYVVRSNDGKVLMQSHKADTTAFPPYKGVGFSQDGNFRFYSDEAVRGSITITVAEPLAHRRQLARRMQISLGIPLVAMLPLSFFGIAYAVRRNLAPIRRLRDALASRGAYDLSPISVEGTLPAELEPAFTELNHLLMRLREAFEAERTFAANAAHELRTPLAGAIAQAQRLRSETTDQNIRKRAADIEATLKRLARLSEKLMQLARVEGGQMRKHELSDLRLVLDIVVGDIRDLSSNDAITLSKPQAPVLSDIDPDIFGILVRNLVENALRHGRKGGPIEISLDENGVLRVVNDADVVPPETLARLANRFERGGKTNEGSGLGLAIVGTICERAEGTLRLYSPAQGRSKGFEVSVAVPVSQA
ncbi:MAG TPA: ATP-binding protein [Ensifer sp.]|nr:ATP-binding protein [Ensifer sp.]